jgi:hypothetical protein
MGAGPEGQRQLPSHDLVMASSCSVDREVTELPCKHAAPFTKESLRSVAQHEPSTWGPSYPMIHSCKVLPSVDPSLLF